MAWQYVLIDQKMCLHIGINFSVEISEKFDNSGFFNGQISGIFGLDIADQEFGKNVSQHKKYKGRLCKTCSNRLKKSSKSWATLQKKEVFAQLNPLAMMGYN